MIGNIDKIIVTSMLFVCILLGLPQGSKASEDSDDERVILRTARSSKKPKERADKERVSFTRKRQDDRDDVDSLRAPDAGSWLEKPRDSRAQKKRKAIILDEIPSNETISSGSLPTSQSFKSFRSEMVATIETPTAGQDLSEQTIQTLRDLGVDEKDIVLARIASSCLHKEMRIQATSSKEEVTLDFGLVSPEKIREFELLGGIVEEINNKVREVKQARPSPIRHPDYASKEHLYSPAALVTLPRRLARDSKVVRKLPFSAHGEPIRLETPDEREQREIRQKMEFLQNEKKRGKSEKDLESVLIGERELFKEYLDYVQRRKQALGGDDIVEGAGDDDEVVEGDAVWDADDVDDLEDAEDDVDEFDSQGGAKITKSELESKFIELVAPKLTHMEVDGYDLYISPQTFDSARVQKSGHTNAEVMEDLGKSPIGPDGKPMNFHHLTHYDFKTHRTVSIIVLLTASHHKEFSGLWHFGTKTYRLPRKRVARHLFNPARQEFNREIIRKFFPKRGRAKDAPSSKSTILL